MILTFLNFNEARFEFRHSPYINQFNREELKIRLRQLLPNVHASLALESGDRRVMRKTLLNIYQESCRDFDPEEQEAVTMISQLVGGIIREKTEGSFFIPQNFQVKLLKLNARNRALDWGYLFTINDTIVMPDNYLRDLMASYQLFMENTRQMSMANNAPKHVRPDYHLLRSHLINFYHEVVHIMQRSPKLSGIYGKIFEHIYRQIWGFIPTRPDQIEGLDDDANFITNPDGFNFEWIVPLYNYQTKQSHYFMPSLAYDYRRQVPVGILIEVKPLPNGCWRLTNRWDRLERYPSYVKKFYGLNNQLYHPNEVLAQLLSEYLVGDQTFNSHMDSFYFYDYINKYVLRSCNL